MQIVWVRQVDLSVWKRPLLSRHRITDKHIQWSTIIHNSYLLGQYGRHFADDIIYFREWKTCILIKIPLKFVPKGPIDNNPELI